MVTKTRHLISLGRSKKSKLLPNPLGTQGRAGLISDSVALSQTPAEAARP